MSAPFLIVCTSIAAGRSTAPEPIAAAIAVASTTSTVSTASGGVGRGRRGRRDRVDGAAALVLDLRDRAGPLRSTVLSSAAARAAEQQVGRIEGLVAAARGRICFASRASVEEGGEQPDPKESLLADLVHGAVDLPRIVCVCDQDDFRSLLAVGAPGRRAAVVHSPSRSDKALLSLLCSELVGERIPAKVWSRPVGFVAARRVGAGLEPSGGTGERARRIAVAFERRNGGPEGSRSRSRPLVSRSRVLDLDGEAGQGLPALLGMILMFVVFALAMIAFGGATTAKARFQRAVDLAAISAAGSMHDDFPRLFLPARLPGGAPNPAHLSKGEYMARARAAAELAAERNGVDRLEPRLRFPDGASFAPLRVRVRLRGEITLRGERDTGAETSVVAEAEVVPVAAVADQSGEGPAMASGGGYSGPLAYRQGKPMRPDVAAAFDRMSAAAAADGVSLTVTSGFRSDAEQQALWNANPDPRWVARPGTSLHRCATELDLGPSGAYGWLAANAPRFGFLKRYSWEPWHFGFDAGPEPCSAAGDLIGSATEKGGPGGRSGEGRGEATPRLPAFVPGQYRQALIDAAAGHDVSAALLAAQLMAESNFNPNAVSSAGAQGIAQFMPATAASYGLADPFDPIASIDAQARMMSELLRQFGSVELALAGYNAGPGAVAACDCIPPYPETQAYVAKILGLLEGAGELLSGPPRLEVRLVD